jgi:predicted RNA methylase
MEIATTPKFVKVKKKYALNNSYFKFRLNTSPSNPFEILEYFKEHNELPFDDGPISEDWFYKCFIEFQKKNGVWHQQFFTPTKTAERIAEIADENCSKDAQILDACCGFGQLTKAMKKIGFWNIEAFDIDKRLAEACFDLTEVDAREWDYKSDDFFNHRFDTVVSNPPYDIKDLTLFLEFVHAILYMGGIAVLLIPSNFLDKDRPAKLVQVLNKFRICHREIMTESFERTATKAEIVVLEKI